ncbi:hypothetical protein ANN_15194 [Periplaneta americana]|uniref:Reverse transcriptase domain-containing protein n=1 Tax=Periplaneta americana TaxID=6978 RepID=A0ABQ8SGY0_PERAM|nr:hypothetical protein ANN_15194 [Periplaneta americana]
MRPRSPSAFIRKLGATSDEATFRSAANALPLVKIHCIEQLKHRIRAATTQITPAMLKKVFRSLVERWELCTEMQNVLNLCSIPKETGIPAVPLIKTRARPANSLFPIRAKLLRKTGRGLAAKPALLDLTCHSHWLAQSAETLACRSGVALGRCFDSRLGDYLVVFFPRFSPTMKQISDSLMAADGDCHHLWKLMAPVRHRWSISDVIGEIRNTVMPSDCSALRFRIRSNTGVPPQGERCKILEKKWEYKGTVHQLVIDFKNAYDSVKRQVLYNIIIEFGIPKKLVRLIKMCLSETYARRFEMGGHGAYMGESRNAYRVLVGRPEGKRHLERPRRKWQDNIKMDLREVEYDDRDWINLAQDRDRWRAYAGRQ